eukprot:29375-Prymnesium_polylepis.1
MFNELFMQYSVPLARYRLVSYVCFTSRSCKVLALLDCDLVLVRGETGSSRPDVTFCSSYDL